MKCTGSAHNRLNRREEADIVSITVDSGRFGTRGSAFTTNIEELELIFENLSSLIESVGSVAGIVPVSVPKGHRNLSSESPQLASRSELSVSPLRTIFHNQYRTMCSLLDRYRAFTIATVVELENRIHHNIRLESELEQRHDALEEKIGASFSSRMVTPSPRSYEKPTIGEISEILALRDKLLSQIER